jgi:hypothetical protein
MKILEWPKKLKKLKRVSTEVSLPSSIDKFLKLAD